MTAAGLASSALRQYAAQIPPAGGTFVTSVGSSSAGGATMPVSYPGSVAAGSRILIAFAIDSATASCSPPTGFSQVAQQSTTTGDGQKLFVFVKDALTSGSEGGTTADITGISATGSNMVAIMAVWTGLATDAPGAVTSQAGSSGQGVPMTVGATGVTASEGDTLVWIAAADQGDSGNTWGYNVPAGFSKRTQLQNGWSSIVIGTLDGAPAGATGTLTGQVTSSNGSSTGGWAAAVVRLAAAA